MKVQGGPGGQPSWISARPAFFQVLSHHFKIQNRMKGQPTTTNILKSSLKRDTVPWTLDRGVKAAPDANDICTQLDSGRTGDDSWYCVIQLVSEPSCFSFGPGPWLGSKRSSQCLAYMAYGIHGLWHTWSMAYAHFWDIPPGLWGLGPSPSV